MSEQTPVLLMNVNGTLYPVGMTEEQTALFRMFIAGISKEGPLRILSNSPIINAHEVVEKVNEAYQGIRIIK